jgi:hypothetical protein
MVAHSFLFWCRMKLLKSRAFLNVYPAVLNLKSEGYTDKQIIVLLKDKYDLDLTISTFKNYLHRIKNNNSIKTVENPILEKKTVLPSTTNKLQNKVLESKNLIPETKAPNNDSSEQPVKKRLTLADIQNEKTEEELRDERIRNITKQFLK